jgi:predicted dehydrogenase
MINMNKQKLLNIVQVGYGYWGPNISKHITASSKTNLVAICDIDPHNINRAAGVFGDKIAYSEDYRRFLDNKNVDAFAVAIPTEPSYRVAMDILAADKHLFIEKPMATNAERAKNITDLAQEKNLIVHCDHVMIYHPIIRYIKKILDSGELGDLIYFDVNRVNLGPIRVDINAMLDLAVHDIAVLDYFCGGKEPYEIQAMGEKLYGNQETLTYLTMRYPGFLAHISSGWVSPLKERQMVIGGTKKLLVFDDVKIVDKLSIYDQGIVQRDVGYGPYEYKVRTGDMVAPYIPHKDALLTSIEHFADCAVNKMPSDSGAEQALRVVKILDAALEQMRKND